MRRFALVLAAAVLVLFTAGLGSAMAQGSSGDRIEKVANRRLAGNAYTSLSGLSYADCEKRCLAETQCKALVHERGGAGGRPPSLCRLYSVFGTAMASQGSDVGYKRQGLADGKSAPPPAQPGMGAKAPAPKPEMAVRRAPPPVTASPPPLPPAPPVCPGPPAPPRPPTRSTPETSRTTSPRRSARRPSRGPRGPRTPPARW